MKIQGSTSDILKIIEENPVEILKTTYRGIEIAFNNNQKSAFLFEIEAQEFVNVLEISIPSKDWEKALLNCLEQFEKFELFDDALDTYLLIKKLNPNFARNEKT